MFWSGNYIAVRELNSLLKEENVTLSQVLEADDILQECKADNKNLMQFLTRPDILAELIALITEEPPQNVELTSQYRLASIACEVLTSDLLTLSDKLSMDAAQMHRLCDFISQPPPLNPLLASYFSKTVEKLLERSTKHDWYLYHIVCLRVLDFFKSRRDFLPNLLRHMATSAIADTFKYFIRLDDLFNKIVMEWFEEHQLLESLVQVVCGGYLPDPAAPEKGQLDASEKHHNHTQPHANETSAAAEAEAEPPARAALCPRLQAVASANAAALLCDVIVCGDTRSRTQETLVSRLASEECVRLLLQSMFTSRPHARAFACVNGCRLLLALLSQEPVLSSDGAERSCVELGVAPHVPLLHQALLADPRGPSPGVGLPRVQLAALLAHLALSDLDEICNALRALGTPGVLIDMMFSFPLNNFLHGEVYTLVKHALNNRIYRTQYAKHLLLECDLLTRLMDVFEENENKKGTGDSGGPGPRAAYMGHVLLMLEKISRALDANDGELLQLLPAPLHQRWAAFQHALQQRLQHAHVPLGGYYPSENIYEVENMDDNLGVDYHVVAEYEIQKTVATFWERAHQRYDDDPWDETPAAEAAADAEPDDEAGGAGAWLPWSASEPGACAGWAQFDELPPAAPLAAPPADPFAPAPPPADEGAAEGEFSAFWPPQPQAQPPQSPQPPPDAPLPDASGGALCGSVAALQLDVAGAGLAGRLLTALSALPPHQRATLVAHHLPGGADQAAVDLNAASVDTNVDNADLNDSSADTNATSADKDAISVDKDAINVDKNATSTDKNVTSADSNANNADLNSTSVDTHANNANSNSTSADKHATNADSNAATAETNATSVDTNAASADTNATSAMESSASADEAAGGSANSADTES